MLCGEYFATLGLPCISFPTHLAQTLTVSESASAYGEIYWKARDLNHKIWLDFKFNFDDFCFHGNAQENAHARHTLISMFALIKEQRPSLFYLPTAYHFETRATFNRNWGLGTSSTLVSLLAQWSGTEAFYLQEKIFGGSGFDVATALSDSPIVFESATKTSRVFNWDKSWSNDWWILFTGKKQNSRNSLSGVKHLLENLKTDPQQTETLKGLLEQIITATDALSFVQKLNQLQELTSKTLGLTTAAKDLGIETSETGLCKYLGAWGGDMVLVNSEILNTHPFLQTQMEKLPWNELCITGQEN